MKNAQPLIYTIFIIILFTLTILMLTSCDRLNNANRTMDTMLGGDFTIYVQDIEQPFFVKNGKVTSVPKGYYIYYPDINGKENLVQSPIAATTIIKTN